MYILVVDDDQFANALVKFVLVKEGYEVETLESPRNAMPLIQKREPDLLRGAARSRLDTHHEFAR